MGQLDKDFIDYLETRGPDARGVQPCIVELFKEFWDDANDEDRRTIWDLMRRYADTRRWSAK